MVIYVPYLSPFMLVHKTFHNTFFMYLGCPTLSHSRSHISAPIWDIYKMISVFKAHDLLSDHHFCQVAPKLQSRSDIFLYYKSLLQACNFVYRSPSRSLPGYNEKWELARIDSSQDYVLQADLSYHQIPLGMSKTRSIPYILVVLSVDFLLFKI